MLFGLLVCFATKPMTIPDWQNHIDEAIARSLRHEGYCDGAILNIRGFSTPTIRRLFSNLMELPDGHTYCEAGLFGGGSFCAAMNNHPRLTAIGYEDESQPFGDATIHQHLRENLAKYGPQAKKCTVFWQDCFSSDPKGDLALAGADGIGVLFYDANHDEDKQRKAWSHFEPALSDIGLVIVDDYHWESVHRGTAQGIADIAEKRRVVKQWFLSGQRPNDDAVWHNGLALVLTERVNP